MAKATTPKTTKPKATKAKAAATKKAAPKKAAPKKAVAKTNAKPWLKSYHEMTPHELPPFEHVSLSAMLEDACQKYATRDAFSCMGKSMTYGALDEQSKAMAAYLQSLGLKKGDRVALMMPNVLQYPVSLMAVLRAGYTVVNVNPLYTPRELEHQLKDSGAKAIIVLENFAITLEKVREKTPIEHIVVATMGDSLGFKGHIVNLVVRKVKKLVPAWSLPGHVSFKDALASGQGKTFTPEATTLEDVSFLQYTGGTTGVSKGATLSSGNVLANAMQCDIWLQTAYVRKGKVDDMVFICALPLYHIFALTINLVMGMQQGALNVLIPNPRDIPAFVKELGKHDFNIFPGLNTLFNALLNNDDFAKLDFSNLRLTMGGGMAVQGPVAARWYEMTKCPIHEGYGLSETSPVATANRFDSLEYTGTIGLPFPGTDIAIRDEDGETDLPLGEVGEICIRGPQVMVGYWNRDDETAKVMTKDNFFRSGDMGFMDEAGMVKIVDRKKDMILVSGFNVYPNEIEDVVAGHPNILEGAAVGVPDEHSGEVVKLFIVKKDASLTEEDVKAYCRENLTGYKCPKYIEFRDELPKTNVGKILRRELRDS